MTRWRLELSSGHVRTVLAQMMRPLRSARTATPAFDQNPIEVSVGEMVRVASVVRWWLCPSRAVYVSPSRDLKVVVRSAGRRPEKPLNWGLQQRCGVSVLRRRSPLRRLIGPHGTRLSRSSPRQPRHRSPICASITVRIRRADVDQELDGFMLHRNEGNWSKKPRRMACRHTARERPQPYVTCKSARAAT